MLRVWEREHTEGRPLEGVREEGGQPPKVGRISESLESDFLTAMRKCQDLKGKDQRVCARSEPAGMSASLESLAMTFGGLRLRGCAGKSNQINKQNDYIKYIVNIVKHFFC